MPYLFFAKKEKCLQIKGMFKHLSGCLSGVVAQSCPTLLRPHGLQPSRLLCPLNSPGKNTGVGYHFLMQGIFPLRDQTAFSAFPQVTHNITKDTLPISPLGNFKGFRSSMPEMGRKIKNIFLIINHNIPICL